ncbi:MAG TPA: zinc ribbon domain-containing protein [Tepidisphaeraceae bacterium]|nr:zinc ribbon domain-containing protein [Tepidisphaeraceae bacterium]
MTRFLLRAFLLMSLLLLAAVTTAWVRSYRIIDEWHAYEVIENKQGQFVRVYEFITSRGKIELAWHVQDGDEEVLEALDAPIASHEKHPAEQLKNFLIVRDHLGFYYSSASETLVPSGSGRTWRIVIPFWLAALLLVSPVAGWVIVALRRGSRLRRGFCRACGYDLRASAVRCPECGTAIAPAARASFRRLVFPLAGAVVACALFLALGDWFLHQRINRQLTFWRLREVAPHVIGDLMVPVDTTGKKINVVVAKALSAKKHYSGPPADARWTFVAQKTLRGTDVTGDLFSTVVPSSQFEVGKSYLLYLSSTGEEAYVVRFAPGTRQSIDAAVKEIAKAAGGVQPKLQLWISEGNIVDWAECFIRDEGTFTEKLWKNDVHVGTVLVKGRTGKIPKGRLDRFVQQGADAPAHKPDPMGWGGGLLRWRDAEGQPHEKLYNPFAEEPNLFDLLDSVAEKTGKPIPLPTTQPTSATRPASAPPNSRR